MLKLRLANGSFRFLRKVPRQQEMKPGSPGTSLKEPERNMATPSIGTQNRLDH